MANKWIIAKIHYFQVSIGQNLGQIRLKNAIIVGLQDTLVNYLNVSGPDTNQCSRNMQCH